MEILFFAIGMIGLFFALLSFVFGEFLHTDSAIDGDSFSGWLGDHLPFFDSDHHIEFSRFLNTGAFLGALSGFGFVAAFVMAQFDKSALESAGWGALGGIALGGLIGTFWVLLRKSEGTVGYDVNSLVGLDATVEERIYRNSYGKVKCSVNGTSVWHSARSVDGSEVEKGATVQVVKVVGNTLYVANK